MLQKKMKVKNLARYKIRYYKNIYSFFNPYKNSVPVFIFGKQRSGTTLLQEIFEYSMYFRVYGEHHPKAFVNNAIKDFNTIKKLVRKSTFPFTVFKPICDSHRILEFLNVFPNCKSIWIFRNMADTVNSATRAFPIGKGTIKIICKGESATDWFYEGTSNEAKKTLREIYKQEFTKYDYISLTWWVRNMLVLEKGLSSNKKVLLVDYDHLVKYPSEECLAIYNFIGAPFDERCVKYVHSQSIRKNTLPQIDNDIETLCHELTDALEKCLRKNRKLHNLPIFDK